MDDSKISNLVYSLLSIYSLLEKKLGEREEERNSELGQTEVQRQ